MSLAATPIFGIIDKLLGIGESYAARGLISKQREPADRLRSKKLEILEEKKKGHAMSTVRLGELYQELEIEMDAYLDSLKLEEKA